MRYERALSKTPPRWCANCRIKGSRRSSAGPAQSEFGHARGASCRRPPPPDRIFAEGGSRRRTLAEYRLPGDQTPAASRACGCLLLQWQRLGGAIDQGEIKRWSLTILYEMVVKIGA